MVWQQNSNVCQLKHYFKGKYLDDYTSTTLSFNMSLPRGKDIYIVKMGSPVSFTTLNFNILVDKSQMVSNKSCTFQLR